MSVSCLCCDASGIDLMVQILSTSACRAELRVASLLAVCVVAGVCAVQRTWSFVLFRLRSELDQSEAAFCGAALMPARRLALYPHPQSNLLAVLLYPWFDRLSAHCGLSSYKKNYSNTLSHFSKHGYTHEFPIPKKKKMSWTKGEPIEP